MIGAVITNASDQLLARVLLGFSDSVFSSWSTYRLIELLESLPPEKMLSGSEISVSEFELPFAMIDREASIRISIAKAQGARAVEFLVSTAREVLAANDLDSAGLKEFRRLEYLGKQVDLEWYLDNLERMAGFAEWTIWTGLPDPMEVGNKQLLLARAEETVDLFVSRIRGEVRRFLSSGKNPTASKESESVVGVELVDVRRELEFVVSRS